MAERLLYRGGLVTRSDEEYGVRVSGHGIWSLLPELPVFATQGFEPARDEPKAAYGCVDSRLV